MSNHRRRKLSRWAGLLMLGIFVAIYLLAVRIEESVYERSKGHWTTYTGDNSPLKYDPVQRLVTDKQGNVWVGTDWGLYELESNGNWQIFTTKNSSLLGDKITALAVDRTGNVWVAGAGLHFINPNGQWTTIQPSRDWESIHALAFDSQGRTWIGTFDGLIVQDPYGYESIYKQENSGLVSNSVSALAIDRQDRVWVGTFGDGVSVLDSEGHWVTYRQGPRMDDNDILTFFTDPQGRMWIGTVHGLSIISPDGTRTSYTGSQWGIAPSSIITVESFALDKQNRIWIAMAGRLVVFDPQNNSHRTYTWDNSGLPGGINALAIDKHEKLWIGTEKGLSVIDLQKELPETIPDSWLAMRTALRVPLEVASVVGGLLFLPLVFEFYRYWYISLMILAFVAALGIEKGNSEKNSKLFSISLSAFVLLAIGLVVIWLLSAVEVIIMD